MIQCEEKRIDIYQILSYCLGSLKRKIVILIKILLNEKNNTPRPELIIQLTDEQSISEEYIEALRDGDMSFPRKDDEILLKRFVYRIKQLVRNYLPHASFSHQLFVYLKKIQTFTFKHNYQFEDYLLCILEQNPTNLQNEIQLHIHQIKNKQNKNTKTIKKQNHSLQQNYLFPISNHIQKPIHNQLKNLWSGRSIQPKQDRYQTTNREQIKADIEKNRPIDIFNSSIKPINDCLDLDITILRAIYFNLQRQKENCSSKNLSESFSNTNKTIKQIEEEMLSQNRTIRDSIKSYDINYCRYQLRLERNPNCEKKVHKRSQTADPTTRSYNYSILLNQNRQQQNKQKSKAETKKKFQTLLNFPNEQERHLLYNQIQRKRNNVLKMKSISISANKGHLQLCSGTKEHTKKISVTFANFKKQIPNNTRKQQSNNLKKKYQIFMNTCLQTTLNDQIEINDTLSPKYHQLRTQKSFLDNPNKVERSYDTIEINQTRFKNSNDENILNFLTENTKKIDFNNFYSSKDSKKKQPTRSVANSQIMYEKAKNTMRQQNIMKQMDSTIKTFMRGNNVNHRNYTGLQYRSKRLFDTLNPELNIKTINKF